MSSISDFQPFPQTGRLAQNLNLSLDDLCLKIGSIQATVYSYIVATVKNNYEGHFIQTGSAPNFQGNIISLCTCKHHMRAFLDVDSWPDTWIAGFTGVEAGEGRNALIYLMKVGCAFKSYYDLWRSDKLSDISKQSKLAHKNKFGDVFQPKITSLDHWNKIGDDFQFQPQNYIPPVPDHTHAPNDMWHKDIGCRKKTGNSRGAILIGDEQYSFLWNKPLLFHSDQLSRGQRKDNLQSLLTLIQREE